MDESELHVYLDELQSSYSSVRVKETIETLLKIHRNIFFNKDEPKYRKLKLSNPTFVQKVWSLAPATAFMVSSGWIQIDDCLEFHSDENLLAIINALVSHRFVFPGAAEWEEESKIENLDVSKKKEDELKKKAALEREKNLEEFKKDKLYREELAKYVKQQIADDRKEFNRRHPKPE